MISITALIDKLTNSETWNTMFTDPLKMGLLMSAVIILIIFLMFRTYGNESGDEDNENSEKPSFFKVLIKTALYVTIANLAMLFLFHGSSAKKLEEKNKSENDKKVLQAALTTVPMMPTPVIQPVLQAPVQPAQTV